MTTTARKPSTARRSSGGNALTSVGVDIRENTITVATIKYTQRKRTLTQIGHYRINGISENGIIRSGGTITEILQNILNANKNTRVNITIGAARKSTLYATEDYKSLTESQIKKAIPTQAPKFFTNHQELTLAFAPGFIRKRKRSDNQWVIVGTPSANVRLVREAAKSTRANVIATEPKAISVLRVTPELTSVDTHIIVNGGDDGTEITVVEDGRITLIRSIPRSSPTDVEPEVTRVIEYLKNQTDTPITTHLLTHQMLATALGAYGVSVTTPSIPDAIDTNDDISDDDLSGGFTALALALAAVPATTALAHYPNVDFLHAGKRSKAARAGGPSPAFFPIVSGIALLGAVGYHVITTNQVSDLRAEVRTLRETVLTGSATEEQRIAEGIEREIETLRNYLSAHEFAEAERTQPTDDINLILSAMPNVTVEDRARATRFNDLTINYERNRLLIPDGAPFARVNVTFTSPDLRAVETDMIGLETHPQLTPSLRSVNRSTTDEEVFAGTMVLSINKTADPPPTTTTEPEGDVMNTTPQTPEDPTAPTDTSSTEETELTPSTDLSDAPQEETEERSVNETQDKVPTAPVTDDATEPPPDAPPPASVTPEAPDADGTRDGTETITLPDEPPSDPIGDMSIVSEPITITFDLELSTVDTDSAEGNP